MEEYSKENKVFRGKDESKGDQNFLHSAKLNVDQMTTFYIFILIYLT